jgi:hypothetical protein
MAGFCAVFASLRAILTAAVDSCRRLSTVDDSRGQLSTHGDRCRRRNQTHPNSQQRSHQRCRQLSEAVDIVKNQEKLDFYACRQAGAAVVSCRRLSIAVQKSRDFLNIH